MQSAVFWCHFCFTGFKVISFQIPPQLLYIYGLKTLNEEDQTGRKEEPVTDRRKDMLVIYFVVNVKSSGTEITICMAESQSLSYSETPAVKIKNKDGEH